MITSGTRLSQAANLRSDAIFAASTSQHARALLANIEAAIEGAVAQGEFKASVQPARPNLAGAQTSQSVHDFAIAVALRVLAVMGVRCNVAEGSIEVSWYTAQAGDISLDALLKVPESAGDAGQVGRTNEMALEILGDLRAVMKKAGDPSHQALDIASFVKRLSPVERNALALPDESKFARAARRKT